MAERRMFAKSIVLSDAFLDMPATSRCLYFTLGMYADDDGFVNSPKAVMRECGATDDDLKILIAKYFLIPFETGVVVIRQWRLNNFLRSDRYHATKCTEEKAQIQIEEDGTYSKIEKPVRKVRNVTPLLNREPKNDLELIEKEYLKNYTELYKCGVLKTEAPIINWAQSRKLTNDAIKKYGKDTVLEAVNKSKDNAFCVEKGYSLSTILSAGVFAGLVNGSAPKKKGVVNEQFNTEEIVF